MKRTTVVLPDDLAALLERERRRRGVSTAAIVREALAVYLAPPTKPLPFVALGRSECRTAGRNVEESLAREWTYERIMGVPDPASAVGAAPRRRRRVAAGVDAGAEQPDRSGQEAP